MKHFLALLCISVLLVSCNKKESTGSSDSAMKVDSTKQKNIDSYNAVIAMFNSGKMDDLNKYLADNFNEHTPWPDQKPGLAGLKEGMTAYRMSFPDLKFTVKDITSDGDLIWAHINMTGTNTGAFMGMPPTGKKMDINGVDIIKVTNGKASDHWGYSEDMKMMQQLGMMPPPGAPPMGKDKMPPPDMKKGK